MKIAFLLFFCLAFIPPGFFLLSSIPGLFNLEFPCNKISTAVDAPATGDQPLSPEAHIANLHKLHSKLVSLVADHDILSSRLLDVATEMAAATETAEKMLKKTELVETRLLAVATEKDGILRKLKNVVKRKVGDSTESIQSLEDDLAHTLKEREVADGKCGKLEEELQSVMLDKDMFERCFEFDEHFRDRFVKELDVIKSEKNIENKENASKISALKEKCRFLKVNRGRIEEVEELIKEVEKMIRKAAFNNLFDEFRISLLQTKMSMMFSRKTADNEKRKKHINSLIVDQKDAHHQEEAE